MVQRILNIHETDTKAGAVLTAGRFFAVGGLCSASKGSGDPCGRILNPVFTWQIKAEDEQLHETEDCPLTPNHRAVTLSLCLRSSLLTVFCDRFLALAGELCPTRHLPDSKGPQPDPCSPDE